MKPLRLNRRTVLRGAGSIAIALPWLEIMGRPSPARAAGRQPRAVSWACTSPAAPCARGTPPPARETAFTLGPILAPLAPMQRQLLVLDGLDMKSAVGEQHQAGICALLTGVPQPDGGRAIRAVRPSTR